MENAGSAPRWRFLITPRWLAWHAFAVVAFVGMCWLGYWQFNRAMAGNPLSWAYTFEWPLFAIFGAVFWGKTIRDEFHIRGGTMRQATGDAGLALPGGAGAPAGMSSPADTISGGGGELAGDEPEDEELAAYNAYLERLNNEAESRGQQRVFR